MAVWWDLRLASLLTHLFASLPCAHEAGDAEDDEKKLIS